MREDEPDVLAMLIRHESVIGELYGIFATVFKDHENFWLNLAASEQKHADSLAELRSNPVTGNWLLHDIPFKPQAIKTSIGYVENQITRAKKGDLGPLQAFSIARDLESALLERQFNRLKDSAPKEIRSVWMDLAADTEGHRKALVEALETEKGKRS